MISESVSELLGCGRIIPSVNTMEALKCALVKTKAPCIMLKLGDISTLPKIVRTVHAYGHKVLLHQDSVKGVARDRAGIGFFAKAGVDAVITMKPQCVRMIRDEGMRSVLGLFVIDSSALETGIQNVVEQKPDAAIVMPSCVPKTVWQQIGHKVRVPLIAGGLASTPEQVQTALDCGAAAVAVTSQGIWFDPNF